MKRKFFGILCILSLVMIFSACGTSFSKLEPIKEGDVIENDYVKITLESIDAYEDLQFISSDLTNTDDEKYILISYLYKNLSQTTEEHANWINIVLYNGKEKYDYVKHYNKDDMYFYEDDYIEVEPLEEKRIFTVIKVPNEFVDNQENLTLNIKLGNKKYRFDGLIPKTYEYITVADEVFDKFTNLYLRYLQCSDVDAFLSDAENNQVISTCITSLNGISDVPYSQTTIHSTLLDVMKSFETMINTATEPEDGTGKWLDRIEELTKSDTWISSKADEFVKDANQITISKMRNQINNYFN